MFCYKCDMMLVDSGPSTQWIHEIIFHQEHFEGQIAELTKEQIIDMLCIITKSLYFDEN
ncbi:MAG: hypothetical protein HY476_00830 [Nitrosarchaeum sp.]|nr:hypothetical protein [Nitrosarchaeum sp.]